MKIGDKEHRETSSGTFYPINTPEKVIDILERAIQNRTRVRLFLGDAETGRDWMEEHDVMGRVGRTTGLHSPILVHNERSMGGGLISTDCIVRIMIQQSSRGLYREVYRHPTYNQPALTIKPTASQTFNFQINSAEYPASVCTGDGDVMACFKSVKKARNWVKFMKGERFCK